VLVVQSLPFLAAVAIAALEGSRINSFAYWRGLEAGIAAALPGSAPRAQAPVQLPTADKQVETVQ
jgi:glucan 1,3-beta-glucosidase